MKSAIGEKLADARPPVKELAFRRFRPCARYGQSSELIDILRIVVVCVSSRDDDRDDETTLQRGEGSTRATRVQCQRARGYSIATEEGRRENATGGDISRVVRTRMYA